MGAPFIGSEALAAGKLTRHQLRSRYVAICPGVYVPTDSRLTASSRATAAWLWTGCTGVLAGRSAAALLGAKWVDDDAPAQVLHRNRRPPKGIDTWSDRFEGDEIELVGGMCVTTAARTALDLACRLKVDHAVAAIDALARATKLNMADAYVLVERYRGRRPIRRARPHVGLLR